MKRDAHPQSLFFIIFRALSKGGPLQVPLTELPEREREREREMPCFQSPLSTISQNSPVNGLPHDT